MRFELLGPVTVKVDGGSLPLGPQKQRSLLAMLMLEPGRVVPLDRLVAALWDGDQPVSAVSNIRTYASRLRSTLVRADGADRLIGRNPGYLLDLDRDELDVTTFDELVADGRRAFAAGRADRAAESFRAALGLWRGAAAEDVYRSAYLDRQMAALDGHRLTIMEEWIAVRQALRDDAAAIVDLRQLTGAYPLRERFWSQLVLSLYRTGEIAGALAAYQSVRGILREELGVDPSPQLMRLHQAVLLRDPALAGDLHSATVSVQASPTSPVPIVAPGWPLTPRELPPVSAHLVGRECELTTIVDAVSSRCSNAARERIPGSPAIVEIVGRPGVGSSALAIRSAALLAPLFPDGQLYADLRKVDRAVQGPGTTAGVVLGRFLRALGFPDHQIPDGEDECAARYRSLVADRRLLVVLDNVTDDAQIRSLLPSSGVSAVITTSTHRLATLDCTKHVALERLSRGDAALLLSELLSQATPSPSRAQVIQLADLCAGIPLALRIVAARIVAQPKTAYEQVCELVNESGSLTFGDLTITLPGRTSGGGTAVRPRKGMTMVESHRPTRLDVHVR